MNRKSAAVAVVLVLLVLTSLALMYSVDVTLEDRPGVRMALPARVGAWAGTPLLFCHGPECRKEFLGEELRGKDPAKCPSCGQPLHPMSKEECEQLAKDTQFVKSLYRNPGGESLYVSVVLTGRERESIHPAERCLKGQGHLIMSRSVLRVPLPGRDPLEVTLLLNERKAGPARDAPIQYTFYAYWFVGQNRETPSHLMRMFWLAWDRVVHSVAHKWAYVAVSGRREEGSDQYRNLLLGFLSELHKAIVIESAPETPAKVPTAR